MTASAVNPETLRKRIQRGWSPEAAASSPPRRRMRHAQRRELEPPCPYLAAMNAWRLPAGALEPGVRGNMRFGL